MQPVLNTSTFIFFITVVLCFLAGAILLVFSGNKNVNNKWLAGYYLTAGYGLLVSFLLYSRLITESPWYHTYRTGYIAGFLLMPFSYFYVRSLLQQKTFRLFDLIHFIPVIVFIIDFFPFYIRPSSYKLQELSSDAAQLNTIWSQFSQGWMGIGVMYVPIRIILTTLYWIFQVRMILRSEKIKQNQELKQENKSIMNWVRIFCACQLLFFVPYYINILIGSQDNYFFVAHTLLAISISITIVILVMRPKILYGLKGIILRVDENETMLKSEPIRQDQISDFAENSSFSDQDRSPANDNIGKENNSQEIYLSGQKLLNLAAQVSKHFETEHSYLKKGFTSAKLAVEMDIQSYLLSAVINQVFKTNFNDFVNKYRVDYAKSLIENGEAKFLTLEALSESCGFSNRNSFTIAFKKHTGTTPSGYAKPFSKA